MSSNEDSPPETTESTTEASSEAVITERTPRALANANPPPPAVTAVPPAPVDEVMTERQFLERLQGRLGAAITQLFGNVMSPMPSATPFSMPRIAQPVEITKEDIEQVDGILGKVEHHIMEQTRRLLRVEIRENLLNAANLPRLRELIRSGKKIKFVRKRTADRDRSHDPLFITFGEGIEEGDEIEEFLIAR